MYKLKIKKELNKKFFKILKKNPLLLEIINKKVFEIKANPAIQKFKSSSKSSKKSTYRQAFCTCFFS
tara:strand:+ start:222 stop:422 length:201 start_codon:yes stop_codon:yes gene_type:complete